MVNEYSKPGKRDIYLHGKCVVALCTSTVKTTTKKGRERER